MDTCLGRGLFGNVRKPTAMKRWLWIVVLFCIWLRSDGQDCSFYHHNSTQVYTTAFFGIAENVSIGTIIAKADARIALRIILKPVDNEVVNQLFDVVIRDNTSVEVTIREPLDKLLPMTRSLYFHLQCTGPSGAYSSLPFLITILDVNDHAPVFGSDLYETSISEFHSVGLPVIESLRAFDADLPNTPNTELQYAIADASEYGYFAIPNPLEAIVTLIRKLDYETGPHVYQLNITVSDRGSQPLMNWTTLLIRVKDEDDQNPIFAQEQYDATITEEIDEFKAILTVLAWDGDLGLNETLKYEIVDGSRSFVNHFVIDQVTGTISLLKPVDRELLPTSTMGFITLTVQATQLNDASRTARATVKIFVEDINDNGPRFQENQLTKQLDLLPFIFDEKNASMELVQLIISDRDTKDNSAFQVFLDSSDKEVANVLSDLFILDPPEGVNQAIWLKAQNISGIIQRFGLKFTVQVIAMDSSRNKRELRAVGNRNDGLTDTAIVHLKFNPVYPIVDNGLSAEAKAFMDQYPATLLIVFGSFICLLLLVILVMAGAYHNLRKQRKVHPFLVTDSTRSSVTISPISVLTTSTESQA